MLSRVNCKNVIDLVLLFLFLTSGPFSMFRSYLTQSSSSNSNRLHITIVYEVKNTRNNFTWFGKLLDSLEADENTGTSDLKAIFLHSQYPLIPYHYRQTSLVQSICPRFQLYSSQVPTSSSSSGPILFGSYPNTHTHTHTHQKLSGNYFYPTL